MVTKAPDKSVGGAYFKQLAADTITLSHSLGFVTGRNIRFCHGNSTREAQSAAVAYHLCVIVSRLSGSSRYFASNLLQLLNPLTFLCILWRTAISNTQEGATRTASRRFSDRIARVFGPNSGRPGNQDADQRRPLDFRSAFIRANLRPNDSCRQGEYSKTVGKALQRAKRFP
jgi:hypothetical protein